MNRLEGSVTLDNRKPSRRSNIHLVADDIKLISIILAKHSAANDTDTVPRTTIIKATIIH